MGPRHGGRDDRDGDRVARERVPRGLDPSISADGTRVAFTGNQLWMDEGLNRDIDTVFVYDRVAHGIYSVGSPGLGVHYERSPELSANGRYVSWRNSRTASEPVKDFGPGAERPVPAFEAFSPACHPPLRSAYRDAVLDDHPDSYWRFGEARGVFGAHDEVTLGSLWNDGTTGLPGALAGDPNGALSLDGYTACSRVMGSRTSAATSRSASRRGSTRAG